MCTIISPTSLLLSATGTLAFKNCGLSEDVSTFTAPEMLQGRASSTKPATERVSVPYTSPSVLLQQMKADGKLVHANRKISHRLEITSQVVITPPSDSEEERTLLHEFSLTNNLLMICLLC